MAQATTKDLTTLPVGRLGLIPLISCKDLGEKVNEWLIQWRKERSHEELDSFAFEGYQRESYLIPVQTARFGSGEAKCTIMESVRGDDIYLMVDVCNYSLTYSIGPYENLMSPDDHFQDLKRVIGAIGGKARRVNVIMPYLYESRQNIRSGRESLDCATALQELVSMGVENIITFDAHDPSACLFTETDNAVIQSAYKQKIKSSTIKINGTMSKEIFVAFATQKGGIGKSTVTALAASYLHNVKGYNVAVVDCDDPQHSIHGLREHEMGLIDSSTYFKALACDHFRRIKKNAYTIVKSNAVNALDDAERMIATEDVKPDVVFFDMPGTLRSNGVIKTLSQMDYIFTPLSADRFVVESTLKFVTMFRDRLMTTGQAKTKGLYLFWTMVDGRERNDLYGIYEEVIAEMGFPVLSTRLPDSKKFRRDLSEERRSVFRSTIFPMDTALLKGSGIREFSEEISEIIRPQ